VVRREYSDGAVPTTLDGNIGSGDLGFNIAESTNWPTGGVNGRFIVTINREGTTEERIECDSRTGLAVTVNASGRGFGTTSAAAHTSGESVECTWSAVEADEANRHLNVPADDDHDDVTFGYMRNDGTRHDLTARHSGGTVIPVAAPVATGLALSQGSGTNLALANHVHTVGVGTVTAGGLANDSINSLAPFTSLVTPPITQEATPTAEFTGQIWAQPSTLSLFMWNGSAWVMLATAQISVADSSGVEFDFTNTSYTAGIVEFCGVSFIAPGSGKVLVNYAAQVGNDSDAATFICPVMKTGGTIGSGTLVTGWPADDSFAVSRRGTVGLVRFMRAGGARMTVSGILTPGNTYNVYLEHKVGQGGTTGRIDERQIIVQPIT
jgi:hypothetical protein